jgi:glyoxylase-like metal-dependent hydrolase (beta-lactamase superfamily II)
MVRKLRDGLWWLDLAGVNAYLVDDDGVLTLVDAGSPFDRRHVERGIVQAAGSIDEVDRVLLTHYDIDHVGTLGRIEALDAELYIGRADRPAFTGEQPPSWRTRKGAFQRAVDWMLTPPSLSVEPVDDGDRIGSFTAYHAPGHTPGHTVYASESLSVVFLGDAVWERAGEFGVPPRALCQDHERAWASVVDLADRLPDISAACQGHGVPFRRHGSDRLAECARRIEQRRRAAP